MGPSCMKSCQDRLKLEELYNCWNKSESRDQESEVDRCHGVNTGAGHVSKGKSPVAQLRWTMLGERHQKRDLKQDLIYQKRDLMRVKLLWQCETGSAVISKGPKCLCSLKHLPFYFPGSWNWSLLCDRRHHPFWWQLCAIMVEAKNKVEKIRGRCLEKSLEFQSKEFVHRLEGNGESWKDDE